MVNEIRFVSDVIAVVFSHLSARSSHSPFSNFV